MLKRVTASFLFLLLVSVSCFAQNGANSKIDEYVQSEIKKQRIPGVSLAILKNGEVVYAKGYGFANLEHNVAVKPETIFQSGSVGKQFTATAVMMLVEEGKINLDEKISKYLGSVPEAWSNITIRQMLTHTSGLTDYPPDFDFRRDYTEDELLKRAQAIPPAFSPGEKWQYSNLAYVTLGILIHKVSGQFYGDFLQERVFKPLGMTSTRVISESDIVLNRAAGYRLVKDEIKNQNWVAPTLNTTADGALYFSVLDVAKWDAALYGERLLMKSSLDQMWTPARLNNNKTYQYGFGWGIGRVNGRRIIEHGGSWQGFTSYIARYVDDRVTVIVLDNLAGGNASKIAHNVAALFNPDLGHRPVEDKEPTVTAVAKDLIQKLSEGTADQNLFEPQLRTELFPARAERLSRFLKTLGPLNTIQLVDRIDRDGDRLYVYQLSFQSEQRILRLTFSSANKIADFGLADF